MKSNKFLIHQRLQLQKPQCKFGDSGICCTNCLMGPCRINPKNEKLSKGTCGANGDIIVARNFIRMIAAGTAAHTDHTRDLIFLLKKLGKEKTAKSYKVLNPSKLQSLAKKLKVKGETNKNSLLKKVSKALEKEFYNFNPTSKLINSTAPKKRVKTWKRLKVFPRNPDREICECLHRSHIGVDANPESLLLQGIRTSLADGWISSMIATYISDILFGAPKLTKSKIGLGVFKRDYVNIIVHGHNPALSTKIVEAALNKKNEKLALEAGAKGINVVGMCCSGNELLMRTGIPFAGNFLMQELAITTGMVESIVVDYQCILPSLVDIAQCYHTLIITTEDKAQIPGSIKIEFNYEKAEEIAEKIVKLSIENFNNRQEHLIQEVKFTKEVIAGFSAENLIETFGGVEKLTKLFKTGKLKGIVAMVGCNNPKAEQNNHVVITKELIKKGILVVGTGCWGITATMEGLMTVEASQLASRELKDLCESLEIPPCIHMGSCVDCSRILLLFSEISKVLGIDIPDLPLACSAPEWMSEKAISIGTYFLGTGLLVHSCISPPISGSQKVKEFLTSEIEKKLGGKFLIEKNPPHAAHLIYNHIINKRKKLNWPT